MCVLHCWPLTSSYMFLQIKRLNAEAYKKTFEEIVRNIDKMENECIPSVSLSEREVKKKILSPVNSVCVMGDSRLHCLKLPKIICKMHLHDRLIFLVFSWILPSSPSSSTSRMWSSCSTRQKHWDSLMMDRSHVSLSLSRSQMKPHIASPGSQPTPPKASSLRVSNTVRSIQEPLIKHQVACLEWEVLIDSDFNLYFTRLNCTTDNSNCVQSLSGPFIFLHLSVNTQVLLWTLSLRFL